MVSEKIIKVAIIAGAASALTYKDKNPRETNEQIIQKVTKNIREILEKIDKD